MCFFLKFKRLKAIKDQKQKSINWELSEPMSPYFW